MRIYGVLIRLGLAVPPLLIYLRDARGTLEYLADLTVCVSHVTRLGFGRQPVILLLLNSM